MNLINSSANLINNVSGIQVPKLIERAGRVCYKSEDKITDDSYIKLIESIINRGHLSVLEHGTFVLRVTNEFYLAFIQSFKAINENSLRYFNLTLINNNPLISFNIRALRDLCDLVQDNSIYLILTIMIRLIDFDKSNEVLFKDILDKFKPSIDDSVIKELLNFSDMYIITDPINELSREEQLDHMYLTFNIICDRGISHEIVRHRVASYSQESTRYCNYSKDKFDNEISFIIPSELANKRNKDLSIQEKKAFSIWKSSMKSSEKHYMKLIELGIKPQIARGVLTTSLKTEIIVTDKLRGLLNFLKLRCAKDAHPDIQYIANIMKESIETLLL